MAITRKESPIGVSKQGNLFDREISEGALDVRHAFRDALTRAFTACKDSRYQIAAKLSEWGSRNVSKDMLDKYTSSNFDYAIYAEDLPSVVAATNTFTPIQTLLDPFGATIVGPEESDYVRLGRLLQEDQKRQIEIARLKTKLGMK